MHRLGCSRGSRHPAPHQRRRTLRRRPGRDGLDFNFEREGAWLSILLALIFGLVNTFVRPIIRLLTLPITMMTLGLFLVVLNALMLLLTV